MQRIFDREYRGVFHLDPADRIVVATALGQYQLVAVDERILQWTDNLSCLNVRR